MNKKFRHYFCTIITFSFLCVTTVACSVSEPILPPSSFDDTKSSDYYLLQAKASDNSIRVDWLLYGVQALIKENRLSAARQLLTTLPANLSLKQSRNKLLSAAEISIKMNKVFNLNSLDVRQLNREQRVRYYGIKLYLDKKKGDINQQIQDYILIEKYAEKDKKNIIANNTWQFLNTLTQEQKQAILIDEHDLILKGWLDLLELYTKDRESYLPEITDTPSEIAYKINQRKEQIEKDFYRWAAYYSNHPALLLKPKLLGEKKFKVNDKNAKKVALLVPLSGSSKVFGDIIKQGYLDAMNLFPDEPQQNVIVLDTTVNSIGTLVQLAESQGATMIVGPLLKNNVAQMQKLNPNIPVLALNKINQNNLTPAPSQKNMCFLSLSPEDEAIDAAKHIFRQKKITPLLLLPKTDLGLRVAQSFAEQWSQLTANSGLVHVQYFDDINTLRTKMNKNIGIELMGEEMKTRHQLSKQSNTKIQSNSSVQPNIDAVYIYATYDEVNLIKPMIEMNISQPLSSAGSPSVYLSSQSNVVNASTDFYFDMQGIQFADIPMIMNPSTIDGQLPINIRNNYALARIYAMGVDAWRLANKFNFLASNRISRFDGLTGQLSTTAQCEITRALSWKQYNRGRAEPIATW